MKLYLLVVGILLISYGGAHSQSKYLGNYTQPAPNAASLGKYVDIPIGYYTGTPSISVPLYKMQEGSINVSASLNYHSSGIKVSELASWVGLGWSLNATGMITRTVRGGPDEGVSNATIPGGYYKDYGITQMPLLPFPVGGTIPGGQIAEDRRNFLEQTAGGNTDCEPDMFTFNFDGYSGRFVFDEARNVRLLTHDNLKVSVVFNNGEFTSWTILAPDGKIYFFGENGKHEVNRVSLNSGPEDPNSYRPSSWCLTKIIDPNTLDTVRFLYTSEVYSYYDLGAETAIFGSPGGPNDMKNACQIPINERPGNAMRTTVYGQRLTNIQSSSFDIEFIAETERQDVLQVPGQTKAKNLNKIRVNYANSQCSRQFELTHGYFSSSSANNWSSLVGSIFGTDISDTKRLKLLSVKETSCDLAVQKAPYIFTYEEAIQLPRRLSYDQDHWGYSNNPSPSNFRLTPAVQHPVCTFFSGSFANRTANATAMKAYSLKSFKDPLGGVTSFEFDSHEDYAGNPIGGLRVEKMTVTDGITGKNIVRKFSYPGGGIVYNMPQYLIIPENEYYFPIGSVTQNPVSYRGYTFATGQVLITAIRQSQSVVPMQDFNGNHIGYGQVKEEFGESGEGGFKVYYFKADQVVGGRTSSRLDMANYTATASLLVPGGNGQFTTGIYGNGQFNNIIPENLTYYQSQNVNTYYPFAPQQVEFGRGQLISEETYDAAGNKIREVANLYEESYRENLLIRGFKLSRSTYTLGSGDFTSTGFNDALTYYKLHTGISHLVSTVVKDFKDGKTMVSTTQYGFESPNHTLKTSETTTNSLGETVINNTFYSFDFNNSATSDNVFQKMKEKNILLPITSLSWRAGKLVGGTVTEYKDFSTNPTNYFINPSTIYAMESSSLVPQGNNLTIGFSSPQTVLLPGSNIFKPKASFNVHATTGKLIEQQLSFDKVETLIWDNEQDLPIAKIDNAKFEDVAFTSFETNEPGNWTLSSNNIVTDNTTIAGTKCYSLQNSINKTGLKPATKYLISYWSKGGTVSVAGIGISNSKQGKTVNGWTYNEAMVTGSATLSISGSGFIDDLRLYPSTSMMTTYCYDQQKRIVATADANNMISYYEYDGLGRLLAIRDFEKNIVKVFEYNYGALNR